MNRGVKAVIIIKALQESPDNSLLYCNNNFRIILRGELLELMKKPEVQLPGRQPVIKNRECILMLPE